MKFTLASIAALALVATSTSLATGCGAPKKTETGGTPTPTPTSTSGIGPGCFTGGDAPILDYSAQATAQSLFAGARWNDPSVVKATNGQYWMYASADHNFTDDVETYRIVSNDGATWSLDPSTPVLTVGTAGAWDAGGIETPNVVYFGGEYHLFYTGYFPQYPNSDPTSFRIGHATSPDGVSWTRSPSPLLAPSTTPAFYDFAVGEPGAAVVNGKLYLYFTAIGSTDGEVIGLTTSPDGSTWSAPQNVLQLDTQVYPASENWVGYSTPDPVVIDGKVHLFVDVANQPRGGAWAQEKIHHAVSADGVTGWVQDSTWIYDRNDFAWTHDEIQSPAPLVDGDTLRLFFSGHALPDYFGIGMSSCPIPTPTP